MEQDGNRDRGITNKDQPGQNASRGGELRRQLLVIEPERLKETRAAVTEMKREEEHSDDIKSGDEIILKAVNHHRVNVVAIQRVVFQEKKTRIRHSHRKMGEVIKNEGEHDEAA